MESRPRPATEGRPPKSPRKKKRGRGEFLQGKGRQRQGPRRTVMWESAKNAASIVLRTEQTFAEGWQNLATLPGMAKRYQGRGISELCGDGVLDRAFPVHGTLDMRLQSEFLRRSRKPATTSRRVMEEDCRKEWGEKRRAD